MRQVESHAHSSLYEHRPPLVAGAVRTSNVTRRVVTGLSSTHGKRQALVCGATSHAHHVDVRNTVNAQRFGLSEQTLFGIVVDLSQRFAVGLDVEVVRRDGLEDGLRSCLECALA